MNHSTARINYNRMSRFYDLLARKSERRFTGIGFQMLAVQVGENVHEIGFGTGHSPVALAQAVGISGKITEVDISEGMLCVTLSRVKQSGLSEQVDLRLGDAADLPFNAVGCDAVFVRLTMELFDSPEILIVLKECRRVLRPGGRIRVVALAKTDGVAVRIYEWAHAKFPDFIDCRSIFVHKVIEEARFRIKETVEKLMWGLPAEIVHAR